MAAITPEVAMATLSAFADPSAQHKHAEDAIHRMAACPGAGAALATVLASPGLEVGLRQLAESVLREQIIRRRWIGPNTSGPYSGPGVEAAEAAVVREMTTRALGDANRRIRTAAAQSVAAIGRIDWPTRWPTLFESLVAGAKGSGATAGSVEQRRILDGSMRCLSYFTESIPHKASIAVSTVLLPHCLSLAEATSSSPIALKRRSIAIVTELLQAMAAHSAAGGIAEVVALVEPGIPAILTMASSHLTATGASEAHFRVQAAILHLLEVLATSFTTLVAPQADGLVKCLFGFASALLPAYVAMDVQEGGATPTAVTDDADFGSDGEDVELEALVSRVLDTLVTVCSSNSKVLSLRVRPWLKEVVALCIGFAQMRDTDIELWLSDATAYVEQDAEDNSFSKKPRSTVMLLTQELIAAHGQVGLRAVVEALAERGMPATALAASGIAGTPCPASGAWKIQEAALLIAGGIGPHINSWWQDYSPTSPGGGGGAAGVTSPGGGAAAGSKAPLPLKAEGIAAACYQILTADPATLGVAGIASADVKTVLTSAPGSIPAAQGLDFLRARALWTAARLGRGMTEAQATPFVTACLSAIGSEVAMPIKIAACKSLGMLTRRMKHASEALKASVPRSIDVLVPLLRSCPPDILMVVLKPLVRAIKAGPEAAAAKARDLSTILVALWMKLANHRDLGDELVFAVVTLVDNPDPSVAGMVAERFGPTLETAIRKADATTSSSATGAAEILRACLQHGPKPPPPAALGTLGGLLHGTMACEDRSVRIAASEAVAAMIFTAGGSVLGAESARDPRTGQTPLDAINTALASLLKTPDAGAAAAAAAADGATVAAQDLPATFAGVMAMAVAQTCAPQIGAAGAASLVQLVGTRSCTVGMPSVSLRLCTAFCSFLAQNPAATIGACASVTIPMPAWLIAAYKAAAPAGTAPVATSGSVPLLACVLLRVCMLWIMLDAPLAQTVITMGLLRVLSTKGMPETLAAVPIPAGAGMGRSGSIPGVVPLSQRVVQLVVQDLVEREASSRTAMMTEWGDDGAGGVAWGVDADESEAAAATADARAAGKLGAQGVMYADIAEAITGDDVDLTGLAGAGMAGSSFMPADEMYMLSELIGADGIINAGMVGMMAAGDEDDEDGDSGFADNEARDFDIDATQADDRDELWAAFHPLKGTDRSLLIRQFFQAASSPASAGGALASLCSASLAALPAPARDQFLAILAAAPAPAPSTPQGSP